MLEILFWKLSSRWILYSFFPPFFIVCSKSASYVCLSLFFSLVRNRTLLTSVVRSQNMMIKILERLYEMPFKLLTNNPTKNLNDVLNFITPYYYQ
ncbi:hypothetical protein QVD17_07509 [Tagetes erecta]|uniref:Uncharacterized protein n=1 Tax=Tagetes erecta TaxID=13708 RepID=A0AAD8LIP8_TARER|nr:hypothetical protein QVD17_07509 [Tagetes erecta]